jgi:hypothetical protein
MIEMSDGILSGTKPEIALVICKIEKIWVRF